jgi:hypothetical protein
MDVVVVPLVRQEAEVGPLMELLDRRERSGLVVHHTMDGPERYRLLYVGSLMEARRAEVPTVGQVPGGHAVQLVDDKLGRDFGLDLVRPGYTWAQYETMLDRHGVQYALVGETSDAAMVVTRHEEQTETLSAAAFYQCDGPNWHGFPEPRVSIGQPCPRRPECGRPDSTIRAY